jgi:hypothetical protein
MIEETGTLGLWKRAAASKVAQVLPGELKCQTELSDLPGVIPVHKIG